MPIARDRSELVVQDDLPVNVAAPEYHGVTVDTYKQNLSSLLIYIEGSSWITEYYSQLLNFDSELSPNQPGLPIPYQQYTLIKQFELKVTDPLTHTQNSETNIMEVTGGATVYTGVIPNVGDMFLADIGDGKEGIFTVTSSDKKALFTSTVYTIEYILTGVNGAQKRLELEEKVVKTVYFRKDHVSYGQNPIIIESEVLSIEKLTGYMEGIKQYYFSRFYSYDFSTLIIPNQSKTIYDPFLVKAVTSLFDNNEHPLLQKIRYLNIEGDNALKQDTIWTALLNLDKRYLYNGIREMWAISTNYWSQYPILKTIRFSGIKSVIYPKYPLNTVDKQYVLGNEILGEYLTDLTRVDEVWVDPLPNPFPLILGNWDAHLNTFPATGGSGVGGAIKANDTWLITVAGAPDGLAVLVDQYVRAVIDNPGQLAVNWEIYNAGDPVIPNVPLIRPVTIDNQYVFSAAFYDEALNGQSAIEIETNNLLNNRSVDLAQLTRLCEDYKTWGLLEQFYYLPILLILLRVTLRKV